MRNLKRALSLAVASVMLLGMMVVGTGAAGYSDVSSEDNQEAIEVLQAVSIMSGDDQGNFNPDKSVTRAEMAVIMTKVLDLNTGNYSVSAMPFTDVPDWAKSYVAAIYAEGVTGGISETEYGTDYPITAAQAALMLMKALGYFQYQSDLADGWLLATIRQAGRIDLFEGIDAGAEEALTRNEVAQLVLNTLEARMVEPTGSQGVQIGDVVVGSTIKYEYITKSDSDSIGKETNNDGENYVELGEDLFDGDLEKVATPGTDDFGRPGTEWKYNNKTVGTYANEPEYSAVVADTYDGSTAEKLRSLFDLDEDDLSITTSDNWYLNGEKVESSTVGSALTYGAVVEIYVNEDVDTDATDIVVYNYTLYQIEEIDTDVTDDDAEDGVSAYIYLETIGQVKDTDFAGYNASTYVEDAYVAVVEDADAETTTILASYIPESVEGSIATRNTSKGTVTVGGTAY